MNRIKWEKISSILFVPAIKKRLVHIKDISADAFIIDLEDAIGSEYKEAAYKDLEEWLVDNSETINDKTLILRTNKSSIEKEAELFNRYDIIAGVAVPKVESSSVLSRAKKAFPNKDILAFIETPLGLVNMDECINMSEVNAIGFGGEDFCVAMGMKKKKEYLVPIKSQMLIRSKAFGKPIYDMVESEYSDVILFKESAIDSKEMGFSGKLAIHPNQVDIINEIYKKKDIEKAKRIIAQYEENSCGFIIIDGEIYEKPHIDALKREYEL